MPSPPRRVLCAETHHDTCAMIEALLKQQGYEVKIAETINQCLAMAAEEPFDLYLLNDKYPDGTSVELCQRLHRLRPLTPIVFFSSAASELNREEGMEAGAQAYLVKPGDISELITTITQLTERRRVARP